MFAINNFKYRKGAYAIIFIAQFDKKITKPIEKDHKILWVTPQEYREKLYHKYQNIILDKYIVMKKESQ